MRSGTTLLVAVVFIFGGAMVAEFSGLVPREAATMPAEAASDASGDGAGDAPASEVKQPAWRDVRIGVIGGFVVACIFVLMRATGEFF